MAESGPDAAGQGRSRAFATGPAGDERGDVLGDGLRPQGRKGQFRQACRSGGRNLPPSGFVGQQVDHDGREVVVSVGHAGPTRFEQCEGLGIAGFLDECGPGCSRFEGSLVTLAAGRAVEGDLGPPHQGPVIGPTDAGGDPDTVAGVQPGEGSDLRQSVPLHRRVQVADEGHVEVAFRELVRLRAPLAAEAVQHGRSNRRREAGSTQRGNSGGVGQDQVAEREQLPVSVPVERPVGSKSDNGDRRVPQRGRDTGVGQPQRHEVGRPAVREACDDVGPGVVRCNGHVGVGVAAGVAEGAGTDPVARSSDRNDASKPGSTGPKRHRSSIAVCPWREGRRNHGRRPVPRRAASRRIEQTKVGRIKYGQ